MSGLRGGAKWFFSLLYALWIISIAGVILGSLAPRMELPVDLWNADKLLHCVAYLWLALLPTLIFKGPQKRFLSSIALVFLGVGLEIGQMYVPGRMFSLADIGANTTGVFLGFSTGKRCYDKFWDLFSLKKKMSQQ